jgi:hypothetical protein
MLYSKVAAERRIIKSIEKGKYRIFYAQIPLLCIDSRLICSLTTAPFFPLSNARLGVVKLSTRAKNNNARKTQKTKHHKLFVVTSVNGEWKGLKIIRQTERCST